jgi:hypothetical protein
MLLHIVTDGGIAVFIERERSGSMLEQQMQQACSDAGQIADLPEHLISDQMKTAGFCPKVRVC